MTCDSSVQCSCAPALFGSAGARCWHTAGADSSTNNNTRCRLPATPPSPLATPMPHTMVVMMIGGLLLDRLQGGAGDIGVDFGDVSHSFCASFPEHHAGVRPDVLRVLDETEPASSLVSSSQVVLVHGHNGRCLSGTSTVNC